MKKLITDTEVRHIIKKFRMKLDGRFTINPDSTIKVTGNVEIRNTNLTRLPLNFSIVSGDFDCSSNKLTTLKGAPSKVGGNFNCKNNNLTTLTCAPVEVGGNFICINNQLISLKGAPPLINQGFYCADNQLTSLINGPITVKGHYHADNNLLKNLKGAPQKLKGSLYLRGNDLDNLLGCPGEIGGALTISESVKSLYMGSNDCILKQFRIEYHPTNNYNFNIPEDIFLNQKHMPTVLRYNSVLDLWGQNDELNLDEFYDVLMDIMDGLR